MDRATATGLKVMAEMTMGIAVLIFGILLLVTATRML